MPRYLRSAVSLAPERVWKGGRTRRAEEGDGGVPLPPQSPHPSSTPSHIPPPHLSLPSLLVLLPLSTFGALMRAEWRGRGGWGADERAKGGSLPTSIRLQPPA